MRTLCLLGIPWVPSCCPPLACMRCEIDGWESCMAGARPETTATTTMSATVNIRTGRFRFITVSGGNVPGGIDARTKWIPTNANRIPNNPPMAARINASVNNCRRIRPALAPTAIRSANSCARLVPRTSRSIDTFTHPTVRSKATAMASAMSVPESCSWRLDVREERWTLRLMG